MDSSLHSHCATCIQRNCTEEQACKLHRCANNCGAIYHECKKEEHELLCCNLQVACINQNYGCSEKLPRWKCGIHLEHCPASIVSCTMNWKRFPMPANQIDYEEPTTFDQQFCLRDQNNLDLAYFPINNLDEHVLRVQKVQELQPIGKKMPFLLRNVMEFGSRNCRPDSESYYFVCGKLMRRDMYSWHVKNYHNDILSGFDSILQRCPLQGCSYVKLQLYPDTPSASLVFIPEQEAFAVKYEVYMENSQKEDLLSSLPLEVLEQIFNFLDPLSLSNVALTSHKLRMFCGSYYLKNKGMVMKEWERIETSNYWRISKKVWKLPHFFTPIKKWGKYDDQNLASHLQQCSHFIRNTNESSFSYGVQEEDVLARVVRAE